MRGPRRQVTLAALMVACLAFALLAGTATAQDVQAFCSEDIARKAFEHSTNGTAPFENKCTAQKYTLLEQQFNALVKLRLDRKEPLTDACMDHVKNFLCLQCGTSVESGRPGSWSLCNGKCESCKLFPLIVPQSSDKYKVCC
ncbi:hypothetical protein HKI87_02g11570 [Chloropicon roscoffensis]|uniref:Uncharacterized protein n=1 Tax=Chloropicon roscoffensis TaxID=1461544 RepID=A0AAX4P145_9CHLO